MTRSTPAAPSEAAASSIERLGVLGTEAPRRSGRVRAPRARRRRPSTWAAVRSASGETPPMAA